MRADRNKFAISKGGLRAFWWGQEAPHHPAVRHAARLENSGLQQVDCHHRARQNMHVVSDHLSIDKGRSNQVPSPTPKCHRLPPPFLHRPLFLESYLKIPSNTSPANLLTKTLIYHNATIYRHAQIRRANHQCDPSC